MSENSTFVLILEVFERMSFLVTELLVYYLNLDYIYKLNRILFINDPFVNSIDNTLIYVYG